jgi:outer membrane protein
MPRRPRLFVAAALLAGAVPVRAQAPAGDALTIAQAVEQATKNYPSVQVSREQMNAATAGIRLARTSYLPRVDALAQENRATRNNIFGLLLPQNVIPSISGPVIGSNNIGTVWGSALGVLVSWEPFDFGLRKAGVAAAEAARDQAAATVRRSEFEVAAAAVDAYLTLAAAQQIVRAAQAGVDRAQEVVRVTEALTNAQLRPGADFSRAQAEAAAARTQLIEARQAVEVGKTTLAQFTGLQPDRLAIAADSLLQLPAMQPGATADFKANPVTAEQDAAVSQTRAQLRALERAYFPKFQLQGAAYARGSGADVNGTRLGAWNGMAPTVQDEALGFTVTFPLMDYAANRARQEVLSATARAQAAKSAQIVTELRARWNAALAQLRGAREIAENTPVQVAAARTASRQANARYQAGLGTIDQVAEAQRLLTQAEIDDALAHLSAWRALAGLATAAGDLQPFIFEASK